MQILLFKRLESLHIGQMVAVPNDNSGTHIADGRSYDVHVVTSGPDKGGLYNIGGLLYKANEVFEIKP
jgi:hypothetical protein